MWAGSVWGPAAPPGQYQVRLTATGAFGGVQSAQTKTQPFAIVRNPKISSTDADLHEQFRLASQISAKVTTAHEAVLKARSIKEQVSDRATKAKDAKITSAAEALNGRLTDVEGEIYQYRNRSSQDPLNFTIKLNNKIAALQGIVESGDYKPTDQSYEVFKDLSAQLDKQLNRLDGIVKDDLATFNQQLARKKIDPVVVK